MNNKRIIAFITTLYILTLLFLSEAKVNPNIGTSSKPLQNGIINIMYTNKDFVANYGVYDLKGNSLKRIYSRKNYDFSDFALDAKNNILYYTENKNHQFGLYKVDLSSKNSKPVPISPNNYSIDTFLISDDTLFFRTLHKSNPYSFTLASYNLKTNSNFNIWNNNFENRYIFNFCYNKSNNTMYTVERSFKDMGTSKFPKLDTHWIFKYDNEGQHREEIACMEKGLNRISVNNNGNKILYDAVTVENNDIINKIYLLNLDDKEETALISPNISYNNNKFIIVKDPKFSADNSGFYFLGTIHSSEIIEKIENGPTIQSNSIYFYDFSTKQINEVVKIPNCIINRYYLDN